MPTPKENKDKGEFSESPCMCKMGSICHFPVLCQLDTARAVFLNICVAWDLQVLQNKGKGKMTNQPCFTPPTVNPLTRPLPDGGPTCWTGCDGNANFSDWIDLVLPFSDLPLYPKLLA